ncbi:NAD(P)-linked oxidoreductase superfamily protein [Hibiscus syriacus]|uniref:NAD(P)-linked oxidoreductase superfamily protein n=1 Tax=Hibiscus syriacus TaxID=106335 RepID=A0A6A2YZB9_HIBSY|nr:NAD(P)-linked oxidoreductase superfamily protein [Hibiscus syriacus]
MSEQQQSIQIPRVKLGTQGLQVSKLVFGCYGLTGGYNDPVPDDVRISIIKHAFHRGITFFDTSDIYGPHTNEILVGKVTSAASGGGPISHKIWFRRTGYSRCHSSKWKPEYVRSCVEGSLKRLDVQYIDLYYQHRVHSHSDRAYRIVPYSPPGRRFFGGTAILEGVPESSILPLFPRFQGENMERN